nr:uncharacterized protein LOC104091361 [Nicotiana tomentosiformis]XP_033510748.1 uncharacterized protein LOC104091361 [Nicotiana tomentosiformis]XP_033510749.1 uncharacterized protein LOC104091361 [Nicotiana tomentosiformis]
MMWIRPWNVREKEKETIHLHSPNQDASVAIKIEDFNEHLIEKGMMHLHSSIQEANIFQQGENYNEDFNGEPVDFVNVADSDNDFKYGKRSITLDDFELPKNFSHIVKFGDVNQDETTSLQQGRTRLSEKHARSLFVPDFSYGRSSSTGSPPIFHIKHQFTGVIGANIDPN